LYDSLNPSGDIITRPSDKGLALIHQKALGTNVGLTFVEDSHSDDPGLAAPDVSEDLPRLKTKKVPS